MSRNPSPVAEQIEEHLPIFMQNFYEGTLAPEVLDLLFGKLNITAARATELFLELYGKEGHADTHEEKIISFIKTIKPHLTNDDYIRAIMISDFVKMDSALHLFSANQSKVLTTFILDELLQLVVEKKINAEQLELLLTRQQNPSTSFLLICRLGDETIYLKFFDVMIEARQNNLIDNEVIQKVMTGHDHLHFNPLLMLMNKGTLGMINHFLCSMVIHHVQGALTKAQYKYLITAATKDGYNPLHDAIKLNDSLLVQNILNLNLKAVELGICTPDDFRKLITSRCKGGFNPLQKIYLSKNMELLAHFVVTMQKASANGYFDSAQILKRCYLNVNNGNFSLYIDALSSENEEMIFNHIAVLRTLVRLEVISTRDYKEQLSKPNQNGFNVFLKAIQAKSPKAIEYVFEDIQQLYTKQEISHMVGATFSRFNASIQRNIFDPHPEIKAQTMQFVMQNCSLDVIHRFMPHSANHQFFRSQTPCNSPNYQPRPSPK